MSAAAPLFYGTGFAAREAVCGCSECGGLDLKHPREGQQLRLRILDPENRAPAVAPAGARNPQPGLETSHDG